MGKAERSRADVDRTGEELESGGGAVVVETEDRVNRSSECVRKLEGEKHGRYHVSRFDRVHRSARHARERCKFGLGEIAHRSLNLERVSQSVTAHPDPAG